jgi:biopolymer transport protein ExbD
MELLVPAKPKDTDVQKDIPVKESKTLSLVLFKDRIVWYNGVTEPIPSEVSYENEDLEALLNSQNESIQELVVFIKPRKESTYGNLVRLLDAINTTELKRYAISDLSDFDLDLKTDSIK